MGLSEHQILHGKVMHKRFFPKVNAFHYKLYYLALPLSQLSNLPIALNKLAPMSFYESDHGSKDGTDLKSWANNILKSYGVECTDGEIVLIAMPRIFGYVFNPVSFWLCYDKARQVRAVICEVNNTFGETHSYLCAHSDGRPISKDDVMQGEKLFHVSPFLRREGHYTFRFDMSDDHFGAWIDFYDGQGEKQLVTSLMGHYDLMTLDSSKAVFWQYPFVTMKAIWLIHWQALKLVSKGIGYISKPKQKDTKVSTVYNIQKISN